ncbi:MAG: hypothetical protein ABIP75_09745 [Pyrinomonadaceae bacterium]
MNTNKYFALIISVAIILTGYTTARAAAQLGGNNSTQVMLGPSNDDMVNAQLLVGNSGSLTGGTNAGAGKEVNEPAHARNRGGASVWYKYVAAADGVLTINTTTRNFDTLISVYKGTNVDSLKYITANDNTPTATTSSVTLGVKSG